MLTEIFRNETGSKISTPASSEVRGIEPSDKQQRDFERLLKKQQPSKKRENNALFEQPLAAPLPAKFIPTPVVCLQTQTLSAQPAGADAVMRVLSACLRIAGVALPVCVEARESDGSLRVSVRSGPLAGAEIQVAWADGRLRLAMRSVNRKQRMALESIRAKLASAVSSIHQCELQIGSGDD